MKQDSEDNLSHGWLLGLLLATVLLWGCSPGSSTSTFDFDEDGTVDAIDCAPEDPAIWPGAEDDWGDGVDSNCDGIDGLDADGDGYAANGEGDDRDCDDTQASIFPGAPETYGDGIDQDCDGEAILDGDGDGTDDAEDCAPEDPVLNDSDQDQDGNSSCDGDCDDFDSSRDALDSDGDGVTSCDGDCDDSDDDLVPGAVELCDGLDNDCSDGVPSDELDLDGDGLRGCDGDCDDSDPVVNLQDSDGDGFTSCGGDCDDTDPTVSPADVDGDGSSGCDGDCAPTDPAVFPGAAEICNALDDDCDGLVPADELDVDADGASACQGDCHDGDASLNLTDADNDGESTCAGDCDDADATLSDVDLDGDGVSSCAGDCAPTDGAVFPGATELCNGADDDCDGLLPADEADVDGDGASACAGDCNDFDALLNPNDVDNDGFSTCLGDCDDNNSAFRPLAADGACDGIDHDCVPDPLEVDDDADGYFECEGDCDDADNSVHPGATEQCNGLDDDCSGSVPGDEFDSDGDGYVACLTWGGPNPAVIAGGDCDDANSSALPGASEPCNGIDDDCNGIVDDDVDLDSDGFTPCQGDCEDSNAVVYPGKWEDPSDTVDEDCNGTTSTGSQWADATLAGVAQNSAFGASVAWAGDVDGDTIPDVLVGSYSASPGGTESGQAWLFLGSQIVLGAEITADNAAATFIGEFPGDWAGEGLATAGDLDGDGLDDLLIGAPRANLGGGDSGAAYLFLAASLHDSSGTFVGGVRDLSQADVVFVGPDSDAHVGEFMLQMNDLDGDARPEIVFSAEGTPYPGLLSAGSVLIVNSSSLAFGGQIVDLATEAAITFEEDRFDAHLGAGLRVVDLDGDGLDDLLMSAESNHPNGQFYAFLGATLPTSGVLPVASADLTFHSGADNSYRSEVTAGDIDGDGWDDVIYAAPYDAAWENQGGKIEVWLSSSWNNNGVVQPGLYDLDDLHSSWVGEAEEGNAGWRLEMIEDLDSDGRPELAVSAWQSTEMGTGSGKVYLVKGSSLLAAGANNLIDADAAFVAQGTSDRFGGGLGQGVDFDGDGLEDLLVGAQGGPSSALPYPGVVYLFLGRDF